MIVSRFSEISGGRFFAECVASVERACLASPLHSTPRCGWVLAASQQIAGVCKK